jgi:trans-aconitate methyltransferase
MGQEMSTKFYNENMERFLLPLEKSPWLDLYQVAATLVPVPDCRVADLGCGTGRFARLLTYHGVTSYWGVDFSPKRIEEARRYVPEVEFEVGDLREARIRARFPEFDTFIVTEVLEHIEDDLGLLAALPQGALVVYSVPTFDAAAHVRVFEDVAAIHRRYGSILATEAGPIHAMVRPAKPANRVFIGSARRR